jgi:hypothetical protein
MIHHDLLLLPARAFPKGSHPAARVHLGSHRDRRPAAADPLPRAQPEQPQRTFLAGPLTTAGGSRQKSPIRNARSATSMCGWEPRGPTGKPRDRRGSLRLARRLGPAAIGSAMYREGRRPVARSGSSVELEKSSA